VNYTSQQKAAPIVALVVMLVAIGYSLIPFRFADTISCGPPLLGAEARTKTAPSTGFIRPAEDCRASGKSRLTVSGVVAFVAVLAAAAAVGLKPLSAECNSGNHDDCAHWWPGMLGPVGERLACQCECHAGTYP
jgi:hypothetical protein